MYYRIISKFLSDLWSIKLGTHARSLVPASRTFSESIIVLYAYPCYCFLHRQHSLVMDRGRSVGFWLGSPRHHLRSAQGPCCHRWGLDFVIRSSCRCRWDLLLHHLYDCRILWQAGTVIVNISSCERWASFRCRVISISAFGMGSCRCG